MLQFKVSEGGRVVIPAELREKHGIEIGDTVVWRDDGDGIRLSSRRGGIRRAQQIVARHQRPGGGAVDELLRDRRDEVARK